MRTKTADPMPALPTPRSNLNSASNQNIIAYASPTFASVETNVLYRGRNREKTRRKLVERAWPEFELVDIDEVGGGLVAGTQKPEIGASPPPWQITFCSMHFAAFERCLDAILRF